jgi:hypothetical protein
MTRAAAAEAAAGGALIMALALPLSRMWLEASLVGHVLAQMPLLALSGWLVGTAFAPRLDTIVGRWNRGGIAGLALVIFTILYWMLPRSIDRAVQDGGYELLKFMWLYRDSRAALQQLSQGRSGAAWGGDGASRYSARHDLGFRPAVRVSSRVERRQCAAASSKRPSAWRSRETVTTRCGSHGLVSSAPTPTASARYGSRL